MQHHEQTFLVLVLPVQAADKSVVLQHFACPDANRLDGIFAKFVCPMLTDAFRA